MTTGIYKRDKKQLKQLKKQGFQKGNIVNLGRRCSDETKKKMGLIHTTHGKTSTRIYKIWVGMLQRCQNSNDPSYYLYGSKGINVCKRWQKFKNFYKDMKKGYSDDLTIDRIDNDGDYIPKNCRWVTRKQQSTNRGNNRFIEYKGIKDVCANWANFFNIPSGTLWNRLYLLNWSIEKSFYTPVKGRRSLCL